MKFLRKILSAIWRVINAFRKVVLNIVFFLILFMVLAVLMSSEDIVEVPQDGLLVLNPSGILVEQETYISPADLFFQQAFNSQPEIPEVNIYELIGSIDSAAEDERIGGLVLDLRNLRGGGLSKLKLVGEHLDAFRQSGKPVIAVGDYYSQNQYYLASHADTIYMNPLGAVSLDGFHYNQMYFKSMLEKLKVNQHIFRVGSYKSAVEPFMLDSMSEEAREANEAWLNELWTQYLNGVQNNRDLAPEVTSGLIEDYLALYQRAGNNQAEMAKQAGLVDELKVRNEMRNELINLAGYDNDKETYRHITYQDYLRTLDSEKQMSPKTKSHDNQIAIIVGRGPILDGHRRAGEIGGDSMAEELRKARLNDDVKAVVVRIDSPGGSAFASEIIRQEILHLREAGKPVIASMSSTAASGGYWIAAGADEIIASPSTITGSIGVFGLFVTLEDSLAELGIYSDGVSTTELPSLDLTQQLDPAAEYLLQSSVEDIYQKFLQLVGDARNMSVEDVHEIAQGRVWTGQAALDNGLVDALGEVNLAIQAAATMAELEEGSFSVHWPKQSLSPGEQFMKELFGTASAWLPSREVHTPSGLAEQALLQLWQDVQILNQFNDPDGTYIRCLECRVD
ncbi:signal peptide peptidase SppA [Aliidiomarina minuta]|uniref:Signal peptide peptidase SppA n=1 Tax=Aliidiomarina minuta TaxID=880057 RepID=A0A432W6F5_9GAMM|nr:signal peptide peptidase SppA [Aliidiomarina minuta]RUO25650.1 signal peptide peptidase SppA [Aliidiomarina minuta]